jgi:hypothetical protein
MEPDVVVQNFISQVCQLYDQHHPKLKELYELFDKFAFDQKIPEGEREKYDYQFWEAVRIWRLEHKKLCENFGFKMTEHNFSEKSYQTPLLYDKQKVIKVEKLTSTKMKVFTEHPKGRREGGSPLVFYLELKEGNWKGTKLRRLDCDNKEVSPCDW